MQTSELTNPIIEKQIEQINEALKDIKYNQIIEMMMIRSNNEAYMRKINKLQEYNKIADMTNQVFEKRLLGIECAIEKINKTISA